MRIHTVAKASFTSEDGEGGLRHFWGYSQGHSFPKHRGAQLSETQPDADEWS